MISEEVRRWLKQADPLTNIQELLLKTCQLSGSFVFGGYNPETSDRDVLIPAYINSCFFGYKHLCYESGKYLEEEFQSFYVKNEEGVVFNLLFFNTDEGYEKWRWATEQMIEERLIFTMDFSDKEFRVKSFEDHKAEWEKNHG